MTRDERIEAAAIGWKAQLDQPTTFRDSLTSALDAALADLGGLDGLADMVGSRLPLAAERVALRADRDRLREALSALHRANEAYWLDWRERDETLEAALATAHAVLSAAESEAGT